MYKIIWLISLLVREFALPNPFDLLKTNVTVFGIEMSPAVLNLLVSILLLPICYLIVGIFYEKGSNPASGSLYFLITYTVITLSLYLLSYFNFAWYGFVALLIIIIFVIWIIRKISGDAMYD